LWVKKSCDYIFKLQSISDNPNFFLKVRKLFIEILSYKLTIMRKRSKFWVINSQLWEKGQNSELKKPHNYEKKVKILSYKLTIMRKVKILSYKLTIMRKFWVINSQFWEKCQNILSYKLWIVRNKDRIPSYELIVVSKVRYKLFFQTELWQIKSDLWDINSELQDIKNCELLRV